MEKEGVSSGLSSCLYLMTDEDWGTVAALQPK